ncbi:MAG: YcbK family protein [Burkholderiales bacterium]
MSQSSGNEPPRRRRFLKAIAGAALAMPALGLPGVGHAYASYTQARRLAFEHTHTGERISLVYRLEGTYVPASLRSLDYFLRDFRTGDQHRIDPELLDILSSLSAVTGSKAPFQVISAYRSAHTNAMLRERGRGVAKSSLHLEGRAIDIRLADVPLADLRDAALSLKAGGVGYYPGPEFVHVDTGRIRAW